MCKGYCGLWSEENINVLKWVSHWDNNKSANNSKEYNTVNEHFTDYTWFGLVYYYLHVYQDAVKNFAYYAGKPYDTLVQ